jgi:uncharacterized protein (TIGR00645 family)
MSQQKPSEETIANKIENAVEWVVFTSRWLQAPLYLGLIAASIAYGFKFFQEIIHLYTSLASLTEETVMLTVLSLIDITMVANLIIIVIIGGWATFVSRLDIDGHKDRPEWLGMINAGTLKIKLTTSLVGVSGIHLLKDFINIENVSHENVKWQVIIHMVFLLSTLILALSDRIMHGSHESSHTEGSGH